MTGRTWSPVLRAIAAIWLLIAGLIPAVAISDQQVLILNAFDHGDPVLGPTVSGIREHLSTRSGLHLSVEYLDAGHDPSPEHTQRFGAYLADKYRGSEIDVVVALGEPALIFARHMRATLFDRAKVVFAEAPALSAEDTPPRDLTWLSGIGSRYGMTETLSLMRRLHPDRTTVLVIDDQSRRVRWLRDSLTKAQVKHADSMVFRDSKGLSLTDIEDRVKTLGPSDIVYYLSYTQGPDGTAHNYREALRRISLASSVPVYGALQGTVGFGAVGGYMLDADALGERVGARVLHLLDGTTASSSHTAEAPHVYLFDYRQLSRFGIDEGDLPAGSVVLDEPDTFYYRYRGYFLAAVATVLALLVYIAVLISGIIRRERARQGLERLIAKSATPLSIDRPPALVREIKDRLTTIVPKLTDVRFHALQPALHGPTGVATPDKLSQLLRSAADSGQNQFSGHHAALVVPTEAAAIDLIACRSRRRLDPVDQRLIDLLTHNVAIECENLKAARLTSSLQTAREIQDAMLPKGFAALSDTFGIDVYATVRPAREVGGDLYDVFPLQDGRLCCLVGDVSDKGVHAALFMAMTRTLIRALAATQSDPQVILQEANARLAEDNRNLMFVTLFLGVLDCETGQMTYANAGHNPPLIRQPDGTIEPVAVETNMALGILPDMRFVAQRTTLSQGAMFVAYTDGVTEAENGAGAQFGENRFAQHLRDTLALSARQVVQNVLAAVDHHAGQTPQSDDITLMVVTR